jgi:hypothetical protein
MINNKFQELCIEKIIEYHNSKISNGEPKLKPSMIYSIYTVNATIIRKALFATTLVSGRCYELTYMETNNELRLNVYDMTDEVKFKL